MPLIPLPQTAWFAKTAVCLMLGERGKQSAYVGMLSAIGCLTVARLHNQCSLRVDAMPLKAQALFFYAGFSAAC